MDLEVVGRHAMLFDDDNLAAFVNSASALVDWNSLSIDRYDVRHLLPSPLPPRRHLHRPSLELELDRERYLDLPSSSPNQDDGSDPVISDGDGYRAVPFQYANPNDPSETRDNDMESGYRPPFPPPNEKVHQIISRTAIFVSKHGSQSEIVLRVKQGDNPTFGFLMPDHHLHAYFRFLVDHQELLKGDKDDTIGNPAVDKNKSKGLDQTGGALSLLGSVYGSGEDEEGTTDNTHHFKRNESEGAVNAVGAHDSAAAGVEGAESSPVAAKKDESISRSPISSKENIPVIKRNQPISTVKAAIAARAKTTDSLDLVSNMADKSQICVPNKVKIELPVVEPPSNIKEVIDKVVEFISKNGKQFEVVLAEQDRAHGRFPFLVPSNRYHTYYLKVLQTSEDSKLPGKGLQRHNSAGRVGDNNSTAHEESDNSSFGSVGSDLAHDMGHKEKFKMVVGKSKKDVEEATPEDSQTQNMVCMDAAAAAAILHAATRGIKNPNLEIFSKTSSGSSQGLGSYVKRPNLNAEDIASVTVDKTIREKLNIAVAGEADSSESNMAKEKIKAERLKRAKMFAAMIKSKAEPFKSEVPRGLSVEPSGSGLSSSDAETGNLIGEERKGSSVPLDVDNSDKSQKSEEKLSVDNSNTSHKSKEKLAVDNDERRSKRKYRSRSSRQLEEEEEEEEEEENKEKKDHKRSKKKHRSHRSSHRSRDRHRHKRRHSSSKDKYSYEVAKHDSSSDDEHHHSRHHHKYDSSSDEKYHTSRRHRENSISDIEHRHSQRRHKHYSSSDDEHRHRSRNVKHKIGSHDERETDLEEGEINMKSDKSKASEVGRGTREASIGLSRSNLNASAPSQSPETANVSDELRAKIRAMLMANR